MERKLKRFSLISKGIRHKLRLSFFLMSIIPILTATYLISNFIGLKLSIVGLITICIFIAILGFSVIKEVTDTVGELSLEAQKITRGDLERVIEVRTEDEVGRLGESLNLLVQRIKHNMQELKRCVEQTQKINLEIKKRALVLSNLLNISSMISSEKRDLKEILSFAVERTRQLGRSKICFLILLENGSLILKFSSGEDSERFIKKEIDKRGILGRIYQEEKLLILDKKTKILSEHKEFQEEFRIKNSICLPIFSKGKVIGILGIGNSETDFEFESSDLELLDIFSKQIAIAIENDWLLHKIKGLEIRDALTGLYNDRFIRMRLQEEIKRAIFSQRPCGFTLLEVDNFREFRDTFGELATESALKKISSILEESISEIDYAGRTADFEFSIILPEKNKKRTLEVAEEIRKRIEFSFSEEESPEKRLTVSGAVTENPLDGTTAEELIQKAKDLVSSAEKNRISY